MAAPSTKQRYSIQIVLLQQINNNDKYIDLGKLLISISSNITFLEFIANAKKKIDKKYGKQHRLDYTEQQGLQLFIRPKLDEDIKQMRHKWEEIVDFDDIVKDYVLQPTNEVIVFLFTEPKSSSPMPVPLAPVPPPSMPSSHSTLTPNKSSAPKPIINTKLNISKMTYTTIKNSKDAKFYKIRVKYFEHGTGRINEILKEFPRNICIGDVKKELSFISGIHTRLQYKNIPNIIDSNKCICFGIKLQTKMTNTAIVEKKLGGIKSITSYPSDAVCAICRNKLADLCIECQADSFVNNHTKNDCINAGATDCEHIFHSHCMHRWLKTRDSCPLDNKAWHFKREKASADDADNENNDDAKNEDDKAQIIHFYYKKLNDALLQHVELNKKEHGIDFNVLTVQELCKILSTKVQGLKFTDKRLFANQIDVTFRKNVVVNKVGYESDGNNIFHICGCKKHAHLVNVKVHRVQFEYTRNDDEKKSNDDEKKGGDGGGSGRGGAVKINIYDSQSFDGIPSSLSITELKKKIDLVMDIKTEKQTLYQHKNSTNAYEFLENDTQLCEIGDLCENLELFVESHIAPINCTFDVFANGYLLPNYNNNALLFDIFSAFNNGSDHNGSDILYFSPRWISRKGAFIALSVSNSEAYYQSSRENSTLPDTLRLSAAWIPYVPQTRKGMTSFLSCLYVICSNHISNKVNVLGMIRYLILNKFPALLLSFKIILDRRLLQLTPHHKAALSNGFYYLFRNMIPLKICKDNSKIFQYSHIVFSYILGFCNDDKYHKYEKFKLKQLIDPVTLTRLIDPVSISHSAQLKQKQFQASKPKTTTAPTGKSIKLFVKTLTGKTITIDNIGQNDKVSALQKSILNQEGIPIAAQKLIFAGKQLLSNNLISTYGIIDKSTLHLVIRSSYKMSTPFRAMAVKIANDDDEEEEDQDTIYSRKTIQENDEFDYVTDDDDIIPNEELSLLLQSYSESNEVYIWDWQSLDCIDYKVSDDDMKGNDNNNGLTSRILQRLNLGWFDITNCIGNNKENAIMKIIPTLSIKNLSSSSTVLTLDLNGNFCALCGAVKDDKNNRKFFLPLYRDIYTADLDKLAVDINSLNLNIDADSWIDMEDDAIDDRQPLEAIVVCFDRSYSMQESCFGDDMSRLDVVKCYWSAFLNRSKAYDYANHIGLIVFDSDVETTCRLSPLYERFRKKVEQIQVRGCTALRDAIKEATKQLIEWKLKDHNKRNKCALRIIALTDGEDNQSSINDINLTQILLKADITCDSIMIGNHNMSLHAVCSATGGYVFYPKTFRDGLRIFELETFLSITERGDLCDRKSNNYIYSQSQLNQYGKTEVDICDENNVPKGKIIDTLQKEHNNMFVSLPRKVEKIEKSDAQVKKKYNKKLKTRKVIREMSDIMKDPHPFWDIYIEDENIFFWKLILCGPSDTPYEGGIFLLYMEFTESYPDKAPTMRFVTPIKHVNVNSYGRICHSIFDRNYNPDVKIRDILNNVYGLLLDPDWDDPLDSVLRQEYADDKDLFRLSVANHVQKHAMMKGRDEWRKELGGNDEDGDSDFDSMDENENENENGGAWIPHNKDNQMDDKIV